MREGEGRGGEGRGREWNSENRGEQRGGDERRREGTGESISFVLAWRSARSCPWLSSVMSIVSPLSSSDISIVAGAPGAVKSFATTGVDGHLVIWNSKVQKNRAG